VNPSVNTANNRLNGYLYDAAGNAVRDAENRRFTYDGENKQVKVEMLDANGNPVATIGEYFYDGDGKRVKKFVPSTGETTIFVYDASGKMVAEYSTIVEPPSTAKASYLTTDHLGSPRILTDANGNVISRRDFHPFGEEIGTLNGGSPHRSTVLGYTTDKIRQQFTAYERDGETEMDFAVARFYKASIGRFYSADPDSAGAIYDEPQTWNGYAFVSNNPIVFVDPFGLWKLVECSSGKRMCWEAEKGDRLTSLAKLVDIPVKFLTQFFSYVDPNNIQIGQIFDISGYDYWAITTSFASMGVDVSRESGTTFDWDAPGLVKNIPDEWQPEKPTGHPIKDGLPYFIQGAEDALSVFLATRGRGAGFFATGLRKASPALRALFSAGSIRNTSIINIRNTLLKNGFRMTHSDRGSVYLFLNAAGEEVRIMRRGGGWDVRIKNSSGNYLDEFGNVASRAQTHNISVHPK
jgi:RHS repeat-associated protein